ncbi:MAG: hypothetical protein Q7R83_04470 [bacterium]|nr:hypothetical protein [bacterium]
MTEKQLAKKFVHFIQELEKTYGPQGWWPRICKTKNGYALFHRFGPHRRLAQPSLFEVSLGAILTQNTSWVNAETALACLASNGLLSAERILAAPLKTLERCVQASGYFHQKAKKLKAFAKFFLSGEAIDRVSLLSVWGIGPETADTILLYGLGKKIFVIDAYTRRLLVSLSGDETWLKRPYDEVRLFCESAFPGSVRGWQEAHALIVRLGKDRTLLRKPSASRTIERAHTVIPAKAGI